MSRRVAPHRPRSRRRLAALTAVLAGGLLAGCGYEGAASIPLPGSIGGDGTYPVTVIFTDATNLVPQETCRTNDTVIGSVESVELDADLHARVVCRIKDSVALPGNAVGRISETSLLGERYVALDPPTGVDPVGVLKPGSTVPRAQTRTDPDVEVVFGALSQVLNGGGLGALGTITKELDTALTGSDLKGTVRSLNRLVGSFNDHRTQIADSLAALDRLAGTLARQRAVIADALDSVPGGLAVLDRQRTRLVRTLNRLSALSRTAVPLIRSTRADTVADLKHLAPVLAQVNQASDELALTLTRVATFPFPSTALSTIKGDYAGMYGTYVLDVDMLNRLLAQNGAPTVSLPRTSTGTSSGTASGLTAQLPHQLEPVTQGLNDLLGGILGGGS